MCMRSKGLAMSHDSSPAGLSSWGYPYERVFVIAGPCSAESPEQVQRTARAIARAGVHLLRSGVWKPRTRPGGFEGVGEKALGWVKDAGRAAGLPVAVEVASPTHLEACLRHGIDAVWIGARSTVSPFVVQDLADALRGTAMPVFVKNPICLDLNLWIGAIERLLRAGVQRIAAIHRGFSTSSPSRYRYRPHWEIAHKLKEAFPSLPMLCDPSHICGRKELIHEVSAQALRSGYDGLMIEAHASPARALSDARQQLTPAELAALLRRVRADAAEATDLTEVALCKRSSC